MCNVALGKKKNGLFTTHPSLAGAVLILASKRYTVFVSVLKLKKCWIMKKNFFTIRFGNTMISILM